MKKYPYLWLAFFFTIGVLTADRLAFVPLSVFGGLAAISGILLVWRASLRIWSLGLLALAAGYFSGWVRLTPAQNDIRYLPQQIIYRIEGTVKDYSNQTKFGNYAFIDAQNVYFGQKCFSLSGSLIAYYPIGRLVPGQVVRFNGKLQAVGPDTSGFNRYLKNCDVFTKFNVVKTVAVVDTVKNIFWYMGESQRYFLSQIERYILTDAHVGVAQALLLGYTRALDKTIRQNYNATGTAHILALSGTHIMLLVSFIGVVGKNTPRNLLGLGTLALLGFYVTATGASASVVRAGLGGGAGLVATLLYRQSNGLNVCGFAWLAQTVWDPGVIYNVGFQLSYAAVIGILFFTPPLRALFKSKNKIIRACWELICVTLAAQLYTTPLILYYFGAFSTYFLLSNLLLHAWSSVALIIGFIFLASFPLAPLAAVLGYALDVLLGGMNAVTARIAALPFSRLSFAIKAETALIFYLIIIGATFLLYFRVKKLRKLD